MSSPNLFSNNVKHTGKKRGRPRKLEVDAILDTAMRAYWHGDPTNVSVNMICKVAGIAKPSVYREFGSEDELMCAALGRYSEQVFPPIFEILMQELPLSNIFRELINLICDKPEFEYGCFYVKLCYSKHNLGPKTLAQVEALKTMAQEKYEVCLTMHGGHDSLFNDFSVKVKARYLAEQIAWAVNQRSLGMDKTELKQMFTLALSCLLPGQ